MPGPQRGERRKRHHYRPQAYLKPWADAKGQVAVRRRGQPKHFPANLINVAVESNLYTLDGDSGPDDSLEVALDGFDGQLAGSLARLRDERVPRRRSTERIEISHLLAIQLVRTPEHLDRIMFPTIVADFCGERPVSRDGMRRYLTEIHLGAEPTESELQGALDYANFSLFKGPASKGDAFEILFRLANEELAPALADMAWSVEICTGAAFVTTDISLTVWRRRRDAFDRVGTGLGSADEVWFPLGPHHVLVLRPKYPETRVHISVDRAAHINRHLAAACNKLAVARLEDVRTLDGLALAPRRPMLRFNSGPLMKQGSPGQMIDTGRSVMHMYMQYDDRVHVGQEPTSAAPQTGHLSEWTKLGGRHR